MNITIINGNSNEQVSKRIELAAQAVCNPGNIVKVITPAMGPTTIENNLDASISAIAILEEIIKNQNESDAFIIGCFSDPGLYAAREITEKPVIGIAQASMVTAVQLGYRFSILSPLRRLKPVLEDMVRRYGFEANCASVVTVDYNVAEVAQQGQLIIDSFLSAGKQAIEVYGADVLILGGAVLSGMDETISQQLGVLVLDPVKCAVGQAESILKMNLRTSKIGGFQNPQKKECKNCPDQIKEIYEP